MCEKTLPRTILCIITFQNSPSLQPTTCAAKTVFYLVSGSSLPDHIFGVIDVNMQAAVGNWQFFRKCPQKRAIIKYSQNVFYIKHFYIYLHTIMHNYGKEHIW